jgi:hypothetical protein
MQSKMIFQQAKQVDLMTLLARLGFLPAVVKQQDYWYLSPFRDEHTASFKINRSRNIWYDHGEGKGGNIIDFAIRFFRCNPQEAAGKILELSGQLDFSFHQQQSTPQQAGEKKEADRGKIFVTSIGPLRSTQLLAYLEERKIPPAIANAFCKEVNFSLYDKRHTAIGFQNRSGGFELRNSSFKGSSSPKDITVFDQGKNGVCVFEGFIDLLSFNVIRPQSGPSLTSCLVLNSLSFFEKSRSLMEQHDKIYLFLDRGKAGRFSTQKAQDWNKEMKAEKYIDCSDFYRFRDDLNAWLIAQPKKEQQLGKQARRRL